MILYFSATGNTRFVAEYLAEILDDETLNLLDRIRRKDYSTIHSQKPFIICSPIYVCEMPRFLASFLRNTTFSDSKEVYFVFTSGGYAGPAGVLARRIFRKKNMTYKGCAELIMPRNYIVNNHYSQLGRDEIESRIIKTCKYLPLVANKIQNREYLHSRHVWFFETLITVPFNPVWCYLKQPVNGFHVTDSCVACGKCEKLCPVNAIQIKDGRPVWKGKSCSHCMSCIQNCPTESIEYENITQEKERYQFSRYKGILETLIPKEIEGKNKQQEEKCR